MIPLIGIIVPFLFVILLGRFDLRSRASMIVLVALMAAVQVAVVLYSLFTMNNPVE